MFEKLLAYPARLAMSASLAVVFSILIATYFKLTNIHWFALAAFLVCFTSPGTRLRQSLLILAALIVALLLAFFLHTYVDNAKLILFCIFMLSLYCGFYFKPLSRINFIFIIIFPVSLLIMLFLKSSSDFTMQDNRYVACMAGGLIGIIISLLLAKINVAKEFKQGVAPLMKSICEYAHSLRVVAGEKKFSQDRSKKNLIEKELSACRDRYPEWIFDTGFNPVLRVGYRYFLIKLDHVVESLFSLSILFTQKISAEMIEQIKDPINKTLRSNVEILEVMSNFLNNKPLPTDAANYTDDITELDAAAAAILPQSIELLDINNDNLIVSAIIKDLKDLRQLLIQLIAALPAS